MDFQVARMTPTKSEAWLGLISVTQLLPAVLDSQLQRDSKMTHFEFMVLTSLRLAPKSRLQMKDLAEATNSTLPRLSHVITRMEKRDLVEKSPSTEDRRASHVELTTTGRRELIRALPRHLELVNKLVIDALNAEQLQTLREITQTIMEKITKL